MWLEVENEKEENGPEIWNVSISHVRFKSMIPCRWSYNGDGAEVSKSFPKPQNHRIQGKCYLRQPGVVQLVLFIFVFQARVKPLEWSFEKGPSRPIDAKIWNKNRPLEDSRTSSMLCVFLFSSRFRTVVSLASILFYQQMSSILCSCPFPVSAVNSGSRFCRDQD